jgi:hypothetical protein
MPRRRDPIKSRELSVLLRDAQPTPCEIDAEAEARARSAREALMRMHRDAEKRGSRLDQRVRNFIEGVKARNDGRLPKPKGGRPFGDRDHDRFLLAIKVQEAIEARGEKRGSIAGALKEIAEPEDIDYDRLREIHYDPDPGWRRDVKLEVARRKWEATVPFSPALWFWEVEFDPLHDL